MHKQGRGRAAHQPGRAMVAGPLNRRRWFRALAVASTIAVLALEVPSSASGAAPPCEGISKKGPGWTSIRTAEFGPRLVNDIAPRTYADTFAANPADPDILYVASASEVHQTTDGGCTWKQILSLTGVDPANPTVPCDDGLAAGGDDNDSRLHLGGACDHIYSVTPTISGKIYVQVGAVYANAVAVKNAQRTWLLMSPDGGASWERLIDTSPDGLASIQGQGQLIVAPSDERVIYATRRESWVNAAVSSLFVSRDAGQTWERRSAPTGRGDLRVWVDPIDPQSLWAISAQWPVPEQVSPSGIYHSSDGGTSWKHVPSPVSSVGHVQDLTVSHQAGKQAQIAAFNASGGLIYSADAGETWTKLPYTHANSFNLEFGRAGRYLFVIVRGDPGYVYRVDLRNKVNTQIASGVMHEASRVSHKEAVYTPGALMLLSDCASPPDQDCAALDRWSGRGV